jgi:glycosyltransferase involved in cell wall biosynthesis
MSISVLIPCRNAEGWIAQCLTSLDLALPAGSEILIYDDASSDGTRPVIEDLRGGLGVPVRLQSNPGDAPIGPGAARNLLLQGAVCDLIAFVDADDHVLPPYFTRMIAAFDAQTDFVRTGHVEQGAASLKAVPLPVLSLDDLDTARNLCPRDHIGPANRSTSVDVSHSWAGLYRRRFLLEAGIRFAETTHCEDRLFTWMTHLRGRAYKHLPLFHYVHRTGVGGITETFDDGVFGIFPAYRAIRALPEMDDPARIEKLCRQFMAICLHHLRRAARDPAKVQALQAEITAFFSEFDPAALGPVLAALTQKDRKRLDEVLSLIPSATPAERSE